MPLGNSQAKHKNNTFPPTPTLCTYSNHDLSILIDLTCLGWMTSSLALPQTWWFSVALYRCSESPLHVQWIWEGGPLHQHTIGTGRVDGREANKKWSQSQWQAEPTNSVPIGEAVLSLYIKFPALLGFPISNHFWTPFKGIPTWDGFFKYYYAMYDNGWSCLFQEKTPGNRQA